MSASLVRPFLVVLTVLAAGCEGKVLSVPPVEHPDGDCSLCDLARDKRSSVVRIQTPTGSGSGTVVDARGWILTNAHVTRGRHTIWIETHEGQLVQGRVIRIAPSEDLALIQADAPWVLWRPVELAPDEPPAPDSFATGIGYPGQEGWLVAHGRIRALRPPGDLAAISFLECDVPIFPGSSGGPLLDSRGRLLGLLTGRFRDDPDGPSFARPASALRRFLDAVR
ncbi:MAG: trypsin-like peptidase domain-containing protein [Planctomycetes bacterium]|nr:trypsin-like peptidase domain-containing protein [Planctomycetota bacterium]